VARRPRIEFAGAVYHVFNRGSGRADLFDSAGAAQAFIDCLFEACERMGWRLHAYGLVRNQYHLALETPRGNLVAGVHWLQSAFGNRFNRFRQRRGHAFRGRYRAILVESGVHVARLVDYIHLKPVRAGVVVLDQLAQFRWASYRHFVRGAADRPASLACADWLRALDGLTDTADGWRAYHEHLAWLMADARRQKDAGFERMERGWLHGGDEFRRAMRSDLARMTAARDWGGTELADLNRCEWEQLLEQAARTLKFDFSTIRETPKCAAAKVALAAWLKRRTSVTNRWLTEKLHMGAPDGVSRYTGQLRLGLRPAARELLDRLTAEVGE